MAEEATAQVESGTTEAPESDAPLADTGFEVPEAFANWFKPESAQEKPAASQKPAPKQEATPPKAEGKQPQQAQTPKDGTTEQKPGADEKKPDEKPDLLMSAFTGADGSFDFDGFAKFAAPVNNDAPKIDLQPQPQQQQNPQDNKPEWQKRLEEEKEYTTNIRANTLGWANSLRQLLAQGVDPQQAVAHVEQQIAATIDDHLNNWKAEREYKYKEDEAKARAEKAKEAEESAAQPVRSRTNMSRIISSLPGADDTAKTTLFNEILFGKDVGAKILDYEFSRAHPGNDKLQPAERQKLAEKFVNGITSDYQALSYFFERALDRAARMNMPKLNQKIAAAVEAATNANRAASQKRPSGSLVRNPIKETPAGANSWDAYFSTPEKMADRIN